MNHQAQTDREGKIKINQAGAVDHGENVSGWVVQQAPDRRGLKVDELVDRLKNKKQVLVSF